MHDFPRNRNHPVSARRQRTIREILRAAEAGLPYQTLAASVLHMVATGKLKLDLVKG